MAYLLDSDTFIESKKNHYAFDFCPAFWDWIEQGHAAGEVFSIDHVRRELDDGKDELTEWSKRQGAGFFLPDDEDSVVAMRKVTAWVQQGQFLEAAKRNFLAGADPFLIAYALAHSHTVVSYEVHQEGQRNKVKIPTVCRGLGVPCERTFDALRRSGARFILANAVS